jgi:5-methylthioribose kinase
MSDSSAGSPAALPGQPAHHAFLLDLGDLSGLHDYLMGRGFAEAGEELTAERAGEGNMNCVIRVKLSAGSLILKQARPWVEKYPSIAAPVERAAAEARFYRFAAQDEIVAAMMPRLLDFDPDSALLVLQDFSPASTWADCYDGTVSLDRRRLKELAGYVSALHGMIVSSQEQSLFRNQAMRRLNHEHIFDVPLRTDGALAEMLNRITPGLQKAAETLRQDEAFRKAVEELGHRYLNYEGTALIHGDFFPGSLLRTADGQLRVIDPEFSFCGDPEFDVGVFCAHLLLSGHEDHTVQFWLQAALEGPPHSESLTRRYAGVEIMRRILGVAQLPISRSLEFKERLLERSREMLLGSDRNRRM